jgi:hypothetical protein
LAARPDVALLIEQRMQELVTPAAPLAPSPATLKLTLMRHFAELILACPAPQVYIYGGFVRDFIVRGETPNDIDSRIVGRAEDFAAFRAYLCSRAPSSVRMSDGTERQIVLLDQQIRKLYIISVLCDDELCFSIDFSFTAEYEHRKPPLDRTDASCNNIKLFIEHQVPKLRKKSNSDSLSLTQVLCHILDKQFVPLLVPDSAYLQGRYFKLIEKGYDPLLS